MKNIFVSAGLCACSLVLLAGCCDEICDAAGDLKADIANQYASCCQNELEQDGWSDCAQEAYLRHERLRNTLLAAETACNNNQDELMDDLLRDFYQILRPRVIEAIGSVALAGSLQNIALVSDFNIEEIANIFVVLDPMDQIDISLLASQVTTSIVSVPMVQVEASLYPLLSGGVAVEAHVKRKKHEIDAGIVEPIQAKFLPASDTTAWHYRFDTAGEIRARTDYLDQTLVVSKGQMTIVELADGLRVKLVPTELKISMRSNGVDVLLTLDDTCPFNELVLDGNGGGNLGVAVSVDSQAEIFNRLGNLGSFWMILPVTEQGDGSLSFDTNGLSMGTNVFPIQPATMSVVMGANGTNTSLPNGRDESCADVDGNGIRDGADELINNYTRFNDCD